MKKNEVDFMYLVIRLRFDAYVENKQLFKVLDDLLIEYEEYFTEKYSSCSVAVLGEENVKTTLLQIVSDHLPDNIRPNAQLYYYIENINGRKIKYHSSWITFK